MISPIQKLQTIISTIPMITRMPPNEIPPMPAPLSALVFICSSVSPFAMDDWCNPTVTPPDRFSLRFGSLLARPFAGQFRERGAGAVVDQAFDEAEDRPLDEQRRDQLRPGEFPVLGLRRLLFVDQPPDLFEDLLAEDPSDQAEDDADRGEDDLHFCASPPLELPAPFAAIAAPAAAAPARPAAASRLGHLRFGCSRWSASARAPSRRLSAPLRRFSRAYSFSASSFT